MKVVFLDTNAYTAFKLGDKNIVEIVQQAHTLGISPIVLGELLSGFEMGRKTDNNRHELKQFLSSPRVKIYPMSAQTAQFYCEIFSCLKRKGKPIPTNDLWISAQVMEQGASLCTYDKHFDHIDGLLTGKTSAELIF
ncbi:MAG: type II toxin-antitoxin system VapC family toxin [Legionellales bacterium]|jgi:tRNA(fMet)-specific endonuclease VapC